MNDSEKYHEGRSEPPSARLRAGLLRLQVPGEGSGFTSIPKGKKFEEFGRIKKALSILAGLLTLFLIWFIVIRPAIAGIYLKQMEAVDLKSRFAEYEIKNIHKTVISLAKYSSGEIPYRYRYVDLLIKLALLEKDNEKQKTLFREAENELKIIYQKNPRDFDYYPTLAKLMIQWRRTDPSINNEVNQVFQQATFFTPNSGFLYYLWGEALKEMGEYQKAKEKLIKALVLFSETDFPGITPEIIKNLKLTRAEINQELTQVEKLIGN